MEYIVYQQRGEQSPVRISNHRDKSDAIRAAKTLLGQWQASGVNPPSIFAAWNGARSIEVWRDGEEIAVFPEQPTKPRKPLAEFRP